MNRFVESRSKLASKVDRLSQQEPAKLDDLLKKWLRIRSTSDFCEFTCSYPPGLADDEADDEGFFESFRFFSPSEIKAHIEPGEDCIGGKHCFPIGGDDETLVYLIRGPHLPISIVHIEDVRSANRIDTFIKSEAKSTNLIVSLFLRLLEPQAFKTTLGVQQDGRYWLILEKREKTVRAEINFENESGSMRWDFRSDKRAREKYFDTLQYYVDTQSQLTLLDAPHQWRRRIQSMLHEIPGKQSCFSLLQGWLPLTQPREA